MPSSHSSTPTRRLVLLTVLSAALGVVGGGAAWVLIHLIGLITNAALFGQFGWTVPSFADLQPSPRIVIVALIGALLISLLARWTPIIRGHGLPEAMEAVLTKESRIAPSTAVAKPVSAAIAIGTGAPFGAEGPIIVTGGALGSLLGQVIRVSPAERKILLSAGAAAGMAATFGAPLAAVVLAIELLLFEFSTRAFVPLVVATSIAAGMHSLLFGSGPLFAVPSHDFAGLGVLPAFAILGIGAGLLAVVITQGLFTIEAGYRRLPIGEFWHPLIGAAVFATIGLFVPRVLGVGYDVIGDILSDKLAVGTVAVLAVAKLVAWWFALGSGTSGGTLAPILLISAGYGSLFGTVANHVAPGLHLAPGAFAVVAMAATFGAATGATFASIVFVFELTRDYDVILPLMGATVLATIVASALMEDTLMTEKLVRRGLKVHTDFEVDPLRTVPVGDIMSPRADEPERLSDEEIAVCVRADDPAIVASRRMLEEGLDQVLVLDGDRVVGVCRQVDLLRARERQHRHEVHQPGWRPSRRHAS